MAISFAVSPHASCGGFFLGSYFGVVEFPPLRRGHELGESQPGNRIELIRQMTDAFRLGTLKGLPLTLGEVTRPWVEVAVYFFGGIGQLVLGHGVLCPFLIELQAP
jgi:hypothetical protein